MLPDPTPTVSWLELAWTLPSAVWWLRYTWRWWRASRRWKAGRRAGDLAASVEWVLLARGMRATLFALGFLLMTGVGLLAMTLPPAPAAAAGDWRAPATALLLLMAANVFGLAGEVSDLLEARARAALVREMAAGQAPTAGA